MAVLELCHLLQVPELPLPELQVPEQKHCEVDVSVLAMKRLTPDQRYQNFQIDPLDLAMQLYLVE